MVGLAKMAREAERRADPLKDAWITGYEAALEFCADDESRIFWPWGSTPRQEAEKAYAMWLESEAHHG